MVVESADIFHSKPGRAPAISIRSIKNLVQRLICHAASRYVAGPTLEDALKVCRTLQRELSRKAAICPWNRYGDQPASVHASYMEALDKITRENSDIYLSIKAPALNYDVSMIGEILDAAAQKKIRVHFDSHGPETANATFRLIDKVLSRHPLTGCTLPARWVRSFDDAAWAIERKLPVRLVKGQWNDEHSGKVDVNRQFMKLTERLCRRARLVEVATHDTDLAIKCLTLLKQAGTDVELEQLYGISSPATEFAVRSGIPVRVYVPFGYGYLPYALSQLIYRPQIIGWLISDLLRKKVPYAAPGRATA